MINTANLTDSGMKSCGVTLLMVWPQRHELVDTHNKNAGSCLFTRAEADESAPQEKSFGARQCGGGVFFEYIVIVRPDLLIQEEVSKQCERHEHA